MPKLNPETVETQSGARYPSPFDQPCAPRQWKRIGDAGGLTQIGVNLCTLPPGCWSSQRHTHTLEDEFVMIISGECVLVENHGETVLRSGDMCAHPAGSPNGHHLINRSDTDVVFLVCSSRHPDDACDYPDIDLKAESAPDGSFQYLHKDGTPY